MKSLSDDLLDALRAESEFPVAGHDVHAEQLAGIHHVLAIGPQRGGGALPGIAAVQQQRAGTLRAHLVHQGFQVGKAADLAVGLGGLGEVEISEGVRLERCRAGCRMLEQFLADQVYGKVGGFAHLKTLVDKMRAQRPGALLLDGGDTWQGSATSLWTNAQDMVDACIALGVNVMTLALGSDVWR